MYVCVCVMRESRRKLEEVVVWRKRDALAVKHTFFFLSFFVSGSPHNLKSKPPGTVHAVGPGKPLEKRSEATSGCIVSSSMPLLHTFRNRPRQLKEPRDYSILIAMSYRVAKKHRMV